MEWQHNISDTRLGITPAAEAVFQVGRAVIERLDYIAEALKRIQATSDGP